MAEGASKSVNTSPCPAVTRKCEELLGRLSVARVLQTDSCMHTLEAAALLLEIGPGDKVIVPSFTFALKRITTKMWPQFEFADAAR